MPVRSVSAVEDGTGAPAESTRTRDDRPHPGQGFTKPVKTRAPGAAQASALWSRGPNCRPLDDARPWGESVHSAVLSRSASPGSAATRAAL